MERETVAESIIWNNQSKFEISGLNRPQSVRFDRWSNVLSKHP